MSNVKWIKITTDMFDNRKIKHLRRLPDGNNIILIWVMLLTMAGRCNADGMIFLTENIPYTSKMLADELDFEENTVQLALRAMEQLGMIVSDDNGFLSIAGWKEYQNVEGMDKIREQNRIRQARFKNKQKLMKGNVTDNVTSRDGHALEEDIDKDKELEKDKDIEDDDIKNLPSSSPDPCMSVVNLFNDICVSYKPVGGLDIKRLDSIEALLHVYGIESIKEAFKKAEASEFLKGTQGGWKMTFDWIIVPGNMAKVLEGNYDRWNKKSSNKNKFNNFNQRSYDYGAMEQALIDKRMNGT